MENLKNVNELKVLLNENKKIFLDKFKNEVILYVLDAFKNMSDIKGIIDEAKKEDNSDRWMYWGFGDDFIINNWDKYNKTIEKYWMKPEFNFVVDNKSFDDPIVIINYPGLEDATNYHHFTNVEDEAWDEGEMMEEILGKKFYYYYL